MLEKSILSWENQFIFLINGRDQENICVCAHPIDKKDKEKNRVLGIIQSQDLNKFD